MNVCIFGSYDTNYSRNQIIRQGLAGNRVKVLECNVPFEEGLRFWKRYSRLFRLHRSLKDTYDILLVPEMNHRNMPVAFLVSKLYRKPLVFDPFISRYDTDVLDRRRVKKHSLGALKAFMLDMLSLKMSDFILTDTRQHLEFFHEKFGVPEKKMTVIYLGANEKIFMRTDNKDTSSKDSSCTVCFYGSFVPLQGIEYIIDAADILRNKDVHFNIMGSGQTYADIRSRAGELELSNVSFLPPVPLNELPRYIINSDIMLGVFGSSTKTGRVIPNKVFQAMAVGKPVITGDTAAVREIMQDRKHIYLCRCASATALADAIIDLKKNPRLRKTIAEKGANLIKEHYSSEAMGSKIKELIQNKLGKIK